MKAKLSIAIDKLHLDKMEDLVRTGKFRNRSHAIEYAIMQYLKEEQNGKQE